MNHSRDTLIQDLFENMNALKRGMRNHMHALMPDCPLSRTQLELLFMVQHMQPVSSKQLAAHMQLTAGAVSQLIEGIERQGFLERHTDEQDRRVHHLSVSAQGEQLIRAFEKNRRRMIETIIKDLSDEELEIWLRVQKKMVTFFKTEITG